LAKGRAKARMLRAEAECKSLECMQKACKNAGVRAVDYLAAIQYLNTFMQLTATNPSKTKVCLVPSESIDIIGEMTRLNAIRAK